MFYIMDTNFVCLHRVQRCIHVSLNRVFAFQLAYILGCFNTILLLCYQFISIPLINSLIYSVLNLGHIPYWSFKSLFCLTSIKILLSPSCANVY